MEAGFQIGAESNGRSTIKGLNIRGITGLEHSLGVGQMHPFIDMQWVGVILMRNESNVESQPQCEQ